MHEPPAPDPVPDYTALDPAQLLARLAGDGDRVPLALIEVCAAHGDSMVEVLRSAMAEYFTGDDYDASDAWWLPFHSAMILGRIPSESAGLLLVELMRSLDAQHEGNMQDWLAGKWPALFCNKPAGAVDAARVLAEDASLDWYMRCQTLEVVLDAAMNQGGDALEAGIAWAAGMAADTAQESVFRTWAAYTLLDFPRERHRALLEVTAHEEERRRTDEPWHQVVFTLEDVEHAFARSDRQPRWRDDRWRSLWRFYDPAEIAARQQRWREEDSAREGMDDGDDWMRAPMTYVRATPKIGRNDPCPCGSGKKYKHCCLDK